MMDKLTKRRSAAKGWVTRQANALKTLLEKPEVTLIELQDAVEGFDQRLDSLDEVQSELELEIEDEYLEKDLDEADKFRTASRIYRIKASERLSELLKKDKSDDGNGSDMSASSTNTKVKLPKLELPKFTGEVTEWQSFWDQFKSHIDDSDIPVISKFSYLVSLLEEEAKSVIQGFSLTSANYKTACDLLKERFGRPERIIFSHVQALLNGNVPVKGKGSKYVSQLWSLRDELLTHIRSLETLGVSGGQCEVFLTPIILSRLPNELRLEWARDCAGKESDLDWLLNFLQREIERIERSETFKDVTSPKSEEKKAPCLMREKNHRSQKGGLIESRLLLLFILHLKLGCQLVYFVIRHTNLKIVSVF